MCKFNRANKQTMLSCWQCSYSTNNHISTELYQFSSLRIKNSAAINLWIQFFSTYDVTILSHNTSIISYSSGHYVLRISYCVDI